MSTFLNGRDALDEFKKNPSEIDLLITDMTMPKMQGGELSSRSLKIRNDLPIILCSGYTEGFNGEKAMELGIKKYFQKPISSQTLLLMIRELLDGK